MENGLVSFKITTNQIVLFLGSIVLIGLIIFGILIANDVDFSITDVMAYLTGSVAIVTLVYNSIAVESRKTFHKETLEVQKYRYTYDIVSKMNEPEMVYCLSTYRYIEDNRDEFFGNNNARYFEEYMKKEGNEEFKINVVMLLNYFEHISILVKNEHIEEQIIKESFKNFFTKGYSIMEPYIAHRQVQNPKAWACFKAQAIKWQEE